MQQNNSWRVDADGGNLKQLTHGKFDYLPVCSPDAKTVFYIDADNRLQKVAAEGGAVQQVADPAVFSRIAISPDGKCAAFFTFRLHDPKEKVALVMIDSSQPPRFLDLERPRAGSLASGFGDEPLRFTDDGKGVIYPLRDAEADNLWRQNLDASPGKMITDFKSEFIRDFDYSHDGKQLAVVRGHRESDVVLIRDSQK